MNHPYIGPEITYKQLMALSAELSDYIKDRIIPSMDLHRRNNVPLTEKGVWQCLFNGEGKIGEFYEFLFELREAGQRITPDLILEASDLVYYSLQPNCREDVSQFIRTFLEILEIDLSVAMYCCILKYSSRLEGYKDDYKQVEYNLAEGLLVSLGMWEYEK